jgi:hypothetical protein
MEQSKFDEIIAQYQKELSHFYSNYPTQELQEAANDYPIFIWSPIRPYDGESYIPNEAQFAWLCDNVTLYWLSFKYDTFNSFNYSLLQKQTTLRKLDIYDSNLTDISWLSNLTNLTELNLAYNQIEDITALANCKKITDLCISFNIIKDISPLAGCDNLQCLHIVDNKISDITPLSGLLNLKTLYISLEIKSSNDLNNFSNPPAQALKTNCFAPLSKSLSLEYLTLYNTNLDARYNLPLIPNLRHLFIRDNKFTKLPPLSHKLEYIDICNNKITDITPLADLKFLQKALISGNPIVVAPSPCLLKPICFYRTPFSYPYGQPNKALPPNAQEIWTLLMTGDYTNHELAALLMAGLQWDKADTDAYIRIAEEVKEYVE